MFERLASLAVVHRQKILIAAVVIVFLLFGAVTEATAHNPAGMAVAGCENGADAVAAHNPNCHG